MSIAAPASKTSKGNCRIVTVPYFEIILLRTGNGLILPHYTLSNQKLMLTRSRMALVFATLYPNNFIVCPLYAAWRTMMSHDPILQVVVIKCRK